MRFVALIWMLIGSFAWAESSVQAPHSILGDSKASHISMASFAAFSFNKPDTLVPQDDAAAACATISRRGEVITRSGEAVLSALKKIRLFQDPKRMDEEVCYPANALGEMIPAYPLRGAFRPNHVVLRLSDNANVSRLLNSIEAKEVGRVGNILIAQVKDPKKTCPQIISSKDFGKDVTACVGDYTP